MSEVLKNGVLEYWSIGVLGFKPITPVLHRSITPAFRVQQPVEE
jgi:hypothetical protein